MHTDLDTLATAPYVTIDDTLKTSPELRRWRPAVGITPKLSDAELLTVAVMQALLGYTSEWGSRPRPAAPWPWPGRPGPPGSGTGRRGGSRVSPGP